MSIFTQNPLTENIEATEDVEAAVAAVTETAVEVTEVTEKEENVVNEKKGIFKAIGDKVAGAKTKVNAVTISCPSNWTGAGMTTAPSLCRALSRYQNW